MPSTTVNLDVLSSSPQGDGSRIIEQPPVSHALEVQGKFFTYLPPSASLASPAFTPSLTLL